MGDGPGFLERNRLAHLHRWAVAPSPPTHRDDPVVRIEDGTAAPRLLVKSETGWLRVHTDRKPLEEAEGWLDRALASSAAPSLVCVIGAGLGWILEVLERRMPSVPVLVVEPDPALANAWLDHRDWSTRIEAGRLRVIAGPDFAGASDAWRLVGNPSDTPLLLVHPVIGRVWPELVKRAATLVARVIADARANDDARRRFEAPYLLNSLANLPRLRDEGDAGALFGRFAAVPAIIFAAGPSLNQNLDAISRIDGLRGRALLVAADTALRPLVHAGVEPHLVVALDPSPINARHFVGLPPLQNTWLVAEASLPATVLDRFAGRTFFFRVGEQPPWDWLTDAGVAPSLLRAWGSVATSAFDLVRRLECDPVYIAALDLSYSNGQPHARGTTFEWDYARVVGWGTPLADIWASVTTRPGVAPVADLASAPVNTPTHLVLVRDWIVDQSAQTMARIVNVTGAGILYGGRIEQGVATGMALPDRPQKALVRAEWERWHLDSRRRYPTASLSAIPSAWRELRDEDGRPVGPLVDATLDAVRRQTGTAAGRPDDASVGGPSVHDRAWPDVRCLPELADAIRRLLSGEEAVVLPDIEGAVALGDAGSALERLLDQSNAPLNHAFEWPPIHASRQRLTTPSFAVGEWSPHALADVIRVTHAIGLLIAWVDRLDADTSTRRDEGPVSVWVREACRAWAQSVPVVPVPDNVEHARRCLLVSEWALALLYREAANLGRSSLSSASFAHMLAPVLALRETAFQRSTEAAFTWTVRVGPWHAGVTTGTSPATLGTTWLGRRPAGASQALEYRLGRALDVPENCQVLLSPLREGLTGRSRDYAWRELVPVIDLRARGVPHAVRVHTLGSCAVLVTPFHHTHSWVVDESGRVEVAAGWPRPIVGEKPWGGGRVAWHGPWDGAPAYILFRPSDDAAVLVSEVPFEPVNMAAHDAHGTVWASASGGVWTWNPEDGARQRAVCGPTRAVERIGDRFRFASYLGTAVEVTTTRTHAYVWEWNAAKVEEIEVEDTERLLPRASREALMATAITDEGLVLLDAENGQAALLCRLPRMLAWAGDSLVITTHESHVFLYPNLATRASALLRS